MSKQNIKHKNKLLNEKKQLTKRLNEVTEELKEIANKGSMAGQTSLFELKQVKGRK